MKTRTLILGLVISVSGLMLTGCAGQYVISTKDGHMITTNGKPEIDKSTGLISYKDLDGSQHQIHQDDVKEMVEK